MFRFLVACFALLLPLQFAWAGAASYCAHESETSNAPHFGHHAHVHDADDGQPTGNQLAPHADCAGCHAAGSMLAGDGGAAHALPGAGRLDAPPPVLPTASALARAPDRPQWLRLA